MVKRILVVDDEPIMLYSVREYLTRTGYTVLTADSGTHALDMLLDTPPDLIISDIRMDGMDGFEFQRRVTALTGNSIPFIFLTGRTDLKDRLAGLRGGADDYVVKPFEPEELEARIAAVLNRTQQVRQEEQRDTDSLRQRILSEIAQRLRTPVTSLSAHLNLLLTERFGENGLERARYLEAALRDASSLRELINDLSWAASEDASAPLVKRGPLRIAPVVRAAAAHAAKLASSRGVTLQVICGGILTATIDGDAMSRALSGLLESAVALSPSGAQVTISATRAADSGVEFVVSDGGGTGSLPEDRGEEVRPLDALSLARFVVKAHGGQLSTRREPNGGQSIVIWLPGRVAKHVGRRQ